MADAAHIVARNVAHLRKSRRMRQDDLSAALEPYIGTRLAPAVMSRQERGHRPWTVNQVAALAKIFDVPVGTLFEPFLPCNVCHGQPPAGFICEACRESTPIETSQMVTVLHLEPET